MKAATQENIVLKRANDAFDRKMGTILRKIQQSKLEGKALRKHFEGDVRDVVIEYLNEFVHQQEGKADVDDLTSKIWTDLTALGKASKDAVPAQKITREVHGSLIQFDKVVGELTNKAIEGAGKPGVRFAGERNDLLKAFALLLATCATAFGAHKGSLVKLAEAGKNSEGAKLGLLVVAVCLGTAKAVHLAYKVLAGDSKEVKTAIEGIRKECDAKAETFEKLAENAKTELLEKESAKTI